MLQLLEAPIQMERNRVVLLMLGILHGKRTREDAADPPPAAKRAALQTGPSE